MMYVLKSAAMCVGCWHLFVSQAPLPAADPVQIATISDKDLDESSGIAVSYAQPDALWLHNDSGDKPDLFLVGLDGRTRARVRLRDTDPYDWEDMCSFQRERQSWLLIGDVGDNGRNRGQKKTPGCRLLLVREPAVPRSDRQVEMKCDVAAEIKFEYEDGRWDCEGIAVDTERQEILLLTKGSPQNCGLYVMPLDTSEAVQKRTARRIASPFIPFATGLDVSADGRTMAVCTMLNGLVVRRRQGESWVQAFQRFPTVIGLPPRKQGETICFDRSGTFLFLNSEDTKQPLWRMSVPQPD